MAFAADLVNVVAIFGIVAVGFNILIGYAGLFSVAVAGLFGVGAYTYAILTTALGWPQAPAAVVSVMTCGAVGTVTSLPSFRVRGPHLVVVSFGIQLVLSGLFENLLLTGGHDGVTGIGPISLFGHAFLGPVAFLPVSVAMLVLAILAATVIARSPLGLVLRAIRDDEVGATALGKRVPEAKVLAFAISAAFAGFAGTLYALYEQYISPPTFAIPQTVMFLTMVLIGGSGTILGPLIGAGIVYTLPQLLLLIPFPHQVAANLNPIVFGTLLVVTALLRPAGIRGIRAAG